MKAKLNPEVTTFLAGLNHPMMDEINHVRKEILAATPGLTENIKWNGPNFCFADQDRITMRIHPQNQIQLIFHRGAKVQQVPDHKIISDPTGLLTWRANDRALVTFKRKIDITQRKAELSKIVADWIKATA